MTGAPLTHNNDTPNPLDASPLLIKAGEYKAQCIRVKEFKQFGGLPKLVLEWDFTLSGKEGLVLPQYFNLAHKKFKIHTHYYGCWTIINNCRRPLRPTRAYMTPKIFLNAVALVLVGTSIPKFPDGTDKPEVFHYSVVRYVKKLLLQNNNSYEVKND